jgi:hypothetical protein
MKKGRALFLFGGRYPSQWDRPGCAPKERGAWPRQTCFYCNLVFFAPRYQQMKSRAYREHECVNSRGESEGQQNARREIVREDLCVRCHHERRFHMGAEGNGRCTTPECTVSIEVGVDGFSALAPERATYFHGPRSACPSFVEESIDRASTA